MVRNVKKIVIAGGILILLGAQFFLLFHYDRARVESRITLINSYQVIATLQKIYSDMTSIVLEKHRAIFTGVNKRFNRESNLNENPQILFDVSNLYSKIQNNPSQVQNLHRLEELIKKENESLKNTKKLHQNKRDAEAMLSLQSGNGTFLIDEIQMQIKEMLQEEEKIVNHHVKLNQNAATISLWLFLVTTGFIYTLLIIGFIFLLDAIRKAKKSEQEKILSENRLKLAVAGTTDGLWDWDILANKVYYSARFKEMLGYSENELDDSLEASVALIYPEDTERVMNLVRLHLDEHIPFQVEFRLRRKDETYCWVQSRGQAEWNESGNPIRMSGFISDISQRKLIEKMKNDFISTVSHELRTPLTSIRGSLGLLLSDIGGMLSEKGKNLLRIAYKNSERLILLINDILDLEKIESGEKRFEFRWVNLKDVIEQSVELNQQYCEKYKIKLQMKQPLATANVFVDHDRLIQVISNLISNAAKFSPEGSTVEISTEEFESTVRVSIQDEGCGISTEFKDRIFSKFAQEESPNIRQKGGTGLGLNISKTIIEIFGGVIDFKSEVNKGSTFFFDLPKSPPPEIVISHDKQQTHQPRFLICEDDMDTAHLLQKIFELHHYAVDIAYTAAQCKLLLNANFYTGVTVDLLLPDENGIDLIQEIRKDKKTHDLPIIVVSVKADEEKRKIVGNALGVIDWLTKPIDQSRLLRNVRRICNYKIPKILYVEDDEDLVKVISYSLNGIANVVHAGCLNDAEAILSKESIDLVILDITLPDGSGLKLLKTLKEITMKQVIIFSASEVSQEISEQVSIALVKSRASEEEVIMAIKNAIEQIRVKKYG